LDLAEEGRISFYPNPTSGLLFLNFDLPQITAVSIALFDINGKPVLPEIREAIGEKTFTLNLSERAAGVYILRLVAGESVMVRRVAVRR
jgi:hypothetical protein